MKYIEYIWLAGALMMLVFFVKEFNHLENFQMIALLVGMGLFAFMFSFRRSQRMKMDAEERAEIERIKEELEE